MNENETADAAGTHAGFGKLAEPRDLRIGQEITGMVMNGRIELKAPPMWPEGASVRVVLVDIQPDRPESIAAWPAEDEVRPATDTEDSDCFWRIMREARGMTEEEQVGSPEAIAAWQAAELTRPQLSPEDLAAWEKDWAAYQTFLKTGFDPHRNGAVPS